MKILIVGFGWTGQKMFKEFKRRNISNVYVASHNTVFDILKDNKYDWVVNCAGVTGTPNVDACEDNPLETMQGNTLFPIRLYEVCKNKNIKLAHFSSGCIYTGEIKDVNEKPNFFGSTYSTSKALSDQYLIEGSLVFRIRMPFTEIEEPKNFLTKIKKYAKTSKLWNGGLNSLTQHDEAVSVAVDYILKNASFGPYNLVNKGAIDLKEVCQIMEIDGNWYTDEEFFAVTKCKRSNCVIPADEKMKDIREVLHNTLRLTKTLEIL